MSANRNRIRCFNVVLCCAVLYCVTQSCSTLYKFIDCSPPGSSLHEDSPGKNTGVGCHAFLQQNLPKLGIEPRSPTFQADSLLAEPPRKPKNTGVSNLSLLQGIFLAQELNQGLPLCRQILYQKSFQGSPGVLINGCQYQKAGNGEFKK